MRLQRSLITALLLMTSVALSQPSAEAVAYSHVGIALVNALKTLPEATVIDVITRAGNGSNFPVRTPITINHPEEGVYTGDLVLRSVSLVDPVVNWYYSRICQTADTDHCGLIPPDEDSDGFPDWEQATLTSLDDWFEMVNIFPTYLSYEAGPQAPTEPPGGREFTCRNEVTAVRGWGSSSYFNESTGQYYFYLGTYVDGTWSMLQSVKSSWDPPTGYPAGWPNASNVAAYCLPITLNGWRAGAYFSRAPGSTAPVPQPHPDVIDGVRRLLAHSQAELDRTNVPMLLLPGLEFDPPLDSAMLLGDEVETRDPPVGGGNDGDIDPGDCDDGWVLTRVVCEIRTLSGNIWQFLSHDAWVPQVNWTDRIEDLQANAQTRFPFTVMAQIPGLDVSGEVNDAFDEGDKDSAAMCQGFQLPYNTWHGLVDGEEVRPVLDICDNPAADWMHEVGRGWVYYGFFVLLSVSFFMRVIRA